MVVSFRKLIFSDLKILKIWLKKPHIEQFFHPGPSRNHFDKKYQAILKSQDIFPLIILQKRHPIGLLQYQFLKNDTGNGPYNMEIEMFIGDSSLIGIGLGPKILKQFVRKYLKREHPLQAGKIWAKPSLYNHRAIKAFEKANFIKRGEDSGHLLMECEYNHH